MSNQPPPPQNPYPPQGGQPGQPYYPQQPQKKSHVLRNVLIAVIVGGILLCGGCFAIVGVGANEVDKAIKEEEKNDKPKAVAEGEAFTHDDYKAAPGWKVAPDGVGGMTIKGLKVTNEADEARTALLTFRLYKGSENLTEIECSSNEIAKGESSVLSCVSFDNNSAKGYDTIKVADAF